VDEKISTKDNKAEREIKINEQSADLLSIQIVGIKSHYKVLQTLWPVLWFEDAEEGNNILTSGISNHNRGVVECRKNSRFDELDNIGRSLENETSIVL
jgi:hypothetical protein